MFLTLSGVLRGSDFLGLLAHMSQAEKPSHFLPAVGRHTDVLEKERETDREKSGPSSRVKENPAKDGFSKVALRRPSVAETPELKKAKLETADAEMKQAGISPGDEILGTQPEGSQTSSDAEIPLLEQANSPSFATQAAEIPGFPGLSKTIPEQIDLTEQDAKLEAGLKSEQDELADAVSTADVGAGLLRHLNSNQGSTNPALFNASLQAQNHLIDPLQVSNSGPNRAPTHLASAPPEMPAWLQEIHQGLQSLHIKADRQYSEIHTGLQSQDVRISHVEAVTAEHSDQHKLTAAKLRSIEDKIKELEALKDAAPRSPRQYPGTGAPRSPRSPRSPRNSHFSNDQYDDAPDMDLVAGGWVDARRDDAIEEVKNILRDVSMLDQVDEIWAPYSRTSFVKICIAFERDLTIAMKRKTQSAFLEKLKAKKYVSGVPGSEGIKLWVTCSKSPEERRMTRAIVLCKEFYARLPNKDPSQPNPFSPGMIDISWNGKVFIGKHQLLGCVHRDGEPGVNDMLLTDARGNHLEWYLFSPVFAQLTERSEEDLHAVWDQFRPSERE